MTLMSANLIRPQLRSALLRKLNATTPRHKSLLNKGFTLVELMIVIVIVGILSAVALPNFLSQTNKAKATECTTKLGAMLSQAGAEGLTSLAAASTLLTTLKDEANTNSELCTFSFTAPTSGEVLDVTVAGKTGSALAGKYAAAGCVNFQTGKRDIKTAMAAALPTGTAASCATPTP